MNLWVCDRKSSNHFWADGPHTVLYQISALSLAQTPWHHCHTGNPLLVPTKTSAPHHLYSCTSLENHECPVRHRASSGSKSKCLFKELQTWDLKWERQWGNTSGRSEWITMFNRQHEKGLRNHLLWPLHHLPPHPPTPPPHSLQKREPRLREEQPAWGTQPGSGEATNQNPELFLSVLLR